MFIISSTSDVPKSSPLEVTSGNFSMRHFSNAPNFKLMAHCQASAELDGMLMREFNNFPWVCWNRNATKSYIIVALQKRTLQPKLTYSESVQLQCHTTPRKGATVKWSLLK